MRSMTGFGSDSQEIDACRVSVRIRTVNHRFLDLVLKMPEALRHAELSLRQRVADQLHRGRVEIRIDIDDRRERPVSVHLNRPWVAALQNVASELEAEGIELTNLDLSDLLRFPDALRISTETNQEDSEVIEAMMSTLESALADLQVSRAGEGKKLQAVLSQLLDSLESLVKEIDGAQVQVRSELESRFRLRLKELAEHSPGLEETRVVQEVAMLVERSDVREELDRLATHLEQFRSSMEGESPIGKKLDFIAQEILRELTTLGAKCRQAAVIQQHVDAKLLCEQIREQVQNIE